MTLSNSSNSSKSEDFKSQSSSSEQQSDPNRKFATSTQPNSYDANFSIEDTGQLDSSEIAQISLLEEKLQVSRHQKKVGEVVVRKQIETKLIEVPIRKEKLIVERIGNNPQKLTEVVINEGNINGFKYDELTDRDRLHVVKSAYLNLETAQKLLDAISQLASAENARIRLEIVTDDANTQQQHQDLCDRILE